MTPNDIFVAVIVIIAITFAITGSYLLWSNKDILLRHHKQS